jgi:adenylate kinase
MRLIMLGAPGSGKGTQSERLVEHLKVPHLSTGEMLREAIERGSTTGLHAKHFIDQGLLVPDETVLNLVTQRLEQPDCASGWLLDGFPRRLSQAEALDAVLKHTGKPLSGVLELTVDDEEVMQRMIARGRSDDQPDVIRQRMVTYHEQTQPLSDYYRHHRLLESIDAMGAVDEVFARLLTAVEKLR